MIDKPVFDFVKEGKFGIPINVPDSPTLGIYLCNGPGNKVISEEDACNQIETINFTGPPGMASVLYYALTFMLSGEDWNVAKIDEWIEVSTTSPEYYQKTIATKKSLEAGIKEGLTHAASAVADYEMAAHDVRKYAEIMKYFAEKDEYMLKGMFIDQVDVHNGKLAMISLVQTWPTLIADFQKLTDEDTDPKTIAKKLKISEAEAMLLTTKNKLYINWKSSFGEAVKGRYERLKGLSVSKEKMISEYRDWLKPYITRYKMTKLGSGTTAGRAEVFKAFADISASSTFTNGIQIWAWKALKPAEARKKEIEKEEDFLIHPYDPWVRENLILDEKNGLAGLYPWLKHDRYYCIDCKKYHVPAVIKCPSCGGRIEKRFVADQIVEEDILPPWKAKQMSLNPSELYYTFFVIDVFRAGSKLPVGEIEDITFSVYTYAVSQNIMLVKLLELKCREMEFEKYIDEILGIRSGEENIMDLVKKDFPELFEESKKEPGEFEKMSMDLRKISEQFGSFFKRGRAPKAPGKFMFVKPGPYETDFKDRITKYYLSVSGKEFVAVRNFLKSKMGVG